VVDVSRLVVHVNAAPAAGAERVVTVGYADVVVTTHVGLVAVVTLVEL